MRSALSGSLQEHTTLHGNKTQMRREHQWMRRLRNFCSSSVDLYAISPPLKAQWSTPVVPSFSVGHSSYANPALSLDAFQTILPCPLFPCPWPSGWHVQHKNPTWMCFLLKRCKSHWGLVQHPCKQSQLPGLCSFHTHANVALMDSFLLVLMIAEKCGCVDLTSGLAFSGCISLSFFQRWQAQVNGYWFPI